MVSISLDTVGRLLPLFQKIGGVRMPMIEARKVVKLTRELEKEWFLTLELHEKLIKDACEKNEKGEPIVVDGNVRIGKDRVKEVNEETRQLMEAKVSFDVDKIKLPDTLDLELTPSEYYLLEPFLSE